MTTDRVVRTARTRDQSESSMRTVSVNHRKGSIRRIANQKENKPVPTSQAQGMRPGRISLGYMLL